MANVLFKAGTSTDFTSLIKNAYTFYYLTDTQDLYLGENKLNNGADLTAAIARIATNEGDISDLKTLTQKLDGAVTVNGSVKKQIKDAIDTLAGSLANVATSGAAEDVSVTDDDGKLSATNVEGALAEIVSMIENTTSGGQIILAHENGSLVYTLYQGAQDASHKIGDITIPVDMVATSGQLVNRDGQGNAGTFIEMTIANADPFYINVASLIEYNSVASTAEIALSQDANHKITATIVEVSGSKLATGSVAKTKLDSAVQTSLGKADTAVQSVVEGDGNGQIKVNGTNVKVHGLGSAAYTDSSAYDASGAAATAKSEVIGNATNDTASSKTIEGLTKRAAAAEGRIATLEGQVGSAVDEQISDAIDALDGSATIATKSGKIVTLKAGVSEANGVISNSSGTDIALAAIASTGTAADVAVADSGNLYTATTVEAALAEVRGIANTNATTLTWQEF